MELAARKGHIMIPKDTFASEAEKALDDFLGEYHQHKCPAHLGENCINCRGTGYNQTPCLMCDKDGIAFKRKRELLAQLQQLRDREVEAARTQHHELIVKKLKKFEAAIFAVKFYLDKPYPDDERWTPYTRFVGPRLKMLEVAITKGEDIGDLAAMVSLHQSTKEEE
jgi:hypothetical protein